MRRPVTNQDPFACPGNLPSSTKIASLHDAVADPESRLVVGALIVLTSKIDDSRSPYLAPNPPAVSSKLSTDLGIERARKGEQAVRIVDLHAVHHRQILIRSPAAHGEAAAEVIRCADAGQYLDRFEDVVTPARHALHGHRRQHDVRRGRRLFGRERRHRHRLAELPGALVMGAGCCAVGIDNWRSARPRAAVGRRRIVATSAAARATISVPLRCRGCAPADHAAAALDPGFHAVIPRVRRRRAASRARGSVLNTMRRPRRLSSCNTSTSGRPT